MTLIDEINNEVERHEDIRHKLYVVTGEKPPTPIDWLKNLPIGTCFVTRGKDTKMYNLDEYHVIAHFPRTTVLLHNQNGPNLYLSVDSLRFSDAMELFETLGQTVPMKKRSTMTNVIQISSMEDWKVARMLRENIRDLNSRVTQKPEVLEWMKDQYKFLISDFVRKT